jgi:hypothetical protein
MSQATYPVGTLPVGFQKLTVSSTVIGLTVPAGTVRAMIAVESQAIRFRDDGTPTASDGYPLAAGATIELYGESITGFKAIRQSSDATLQILYYGSR